MKPTRIIPGRWLGPLRSARHRLRRAGVDALAGAERATAAPTVALTFDDGPHPGTSDRILDLLADHQVWATFFCVGRNALAHPALLRRIAAEGHAVGSHSFSHPDPEHTALRELGRDYRRGQQAVAEALGRPVTLFRPPRGFIDPLRAGQLRALQLRGLPLRPRLWSVDPVDWHPDTRAPQIAEVAGRSEPGDVVLLHDWIEQPWHDSVRNRAETIAALPEVIRAVRRRGLEFAALPDAPAVRAPTS